MLNNIGFVLEEVIYTINFIQKEWLNQIQNDKEKLCVNRVSAVIG